MSRSTISTAEEYKRHAFVAAAGIALLLASLLATEAILEIFSFRLEPVYIHRLDIALALLISLNITVFLQRESSKRTRRQRILGTMLLVCPALQLACWIFLPSEQIVQTTQAGALKVKQIRSYDWTYDSYWGNQITVMMERQFCLGLVKQRKQLLFVQPALKLETEIFDQGKAIRIATAEPWYRSCRGWTFSGDWHHQANQRIESVEVPLNPHEE